MITAHVTVYLFTYVVLFCLALIRFHIFVVVANIMDRVKSSMQQVPNPIPKVLSRRTGGANSLEVERENFERSQVGESRQLPAVGYYQIG